MENINKKYSLYDIIYSMKLMWIVLLWVLHGVGDAFGAASFLQPQKFPGVFNDASFVTRVNVLAQGYEPWESEFDSSGRCVRGCAYHGITIEDELKAMQNKTNQVIEDLQQNGVLQHMYSPQATVQNLIANTPTNQIVQAVSCKPNQTMIPSGQKLPLGEPVMGKPSITSPFGRRVHPVTNKVHNHNGVDFGVARGTLVFSPANGVVANVWVDDTCGRGVKISHADGYETLYCHLDNVVVSVGDNVSAGCQIAVSGNTGRSTGPHLHYAIKKDGTFIDPTALLGR